MYTYVNTNMPLWKAQWCTPINYVEFENSTDQGALEFPFKEWVSEPVLLSPSRLSRKLTAVRFLVVRFRPDVWWFGLILLFRGLLLSVPAVIVTDMPSIHLATWQIVC